MKRKKKTKRFYVITKNWKKRKYYISGGYTKASANKFVKWAKKGGLVATKLTPTQRRALPKHITKKVIARIKRKNR